MSSYGTPVEGLNLRAISTFHKEVVMAERNVSPEIHDYLSKQGKKGGRIGGQKVKELIEAGKKALQEEETEGEEGKVRGKHEEEEDEDQD